MESSRLLNALWRHLDPNKEGVWRCEKGESTGRSHGSPDDDGLLPRAHGCRRASDIESFACPRLMRRPKGRVGASSRLKAVRTTTASWQDTAASPSKSASEGGSVALQSIHEENLAEEKANPVAPCLEG